MCLRWRSVLNALIYVGHICLDKLLELILGLLLGSRKSCSPPETIEQQRIVTKSALELAELIKQRKLKSYDVVRAFYDRLIKVNPELNAIVDGPFPEALEKAKAIDDDFENNRISEDELKRKPFLGVPFTTKDSTAVAGKLHTLGLISRKTERATEDAECVRLMKESGAIIIATSNIPEVNKWMETRNMLVGQTKNPYDFRRSVGGSSGGEAALISACCSSFGLGTDIGGSIRIPAYNCGIFGHKPTKNAVNMRGCTFRSGKEQNTMASAGPLARYAKDLMPIFKVIAGQEMSKTLKLDQQVNLKSVRYFYIPCNNMTQCNPVTGEIQSIMLKIKNHFESISGVEVKLAQLPGTELTGKMWRYWMSKESTNYNLLFGNGKKLNPFVELFKKIIGCSELTMASIYSLIDSVLPSENEKMIKEATIKCKGALNELLGDNGVLFYHSSPRTAPFHYYPLIKLMDFSYFSIFNVLQVPVTQVPMGLSTNGVPLGVQVVASEMNDRLCIAVAEELERSFGGWVPPFILKD